MRAVAGSGEHIKALVRSHASGDDRSFYAVASQIAARAARQGHTRLAGDLKRTIDASRDRPVAAPATPVTPIAQPRGDLAELVTASFPSASLKDFVGPSETVDSIKQVLTEQRQRARLLDHGFTPARRLLLEGPPGTGKTMTASVIAHELSLPLLTIRLDSLLSKYLGETATKLRSVFDAADSQRAVYLFDEFDSLGADRAGNDVGEARRILNSFLVFLENTGSASIIVAATNHRGILDRALFRRFDLAITYGLPERRHALAVMKARLGPLADGTKWPPPETTAQLSHAELVHAAESAAKAALLRGDHSVTTADLAYALRIRQTASRA
jgi:SpoVK/Ycf46/Vps4 family AAA+-type ATPase